jgi:hypothetical protein
MYEKNTYILYIYIYIYCKRRERKKRKFYILRKKYIKGNICKYVNINLKLYIYALIFFHTHNITKLQRNKRDEKHTRKKKR